MITIYFLFFFQQARAAAPLPNLDPIATKLLRMDLSRVITTEDPDFQFYKVGKETWLIGLRQSFRIHTSAKKAAALLANPKAFQGLFNGLKEARAVDIKNKRSYSVYTVTAMPVPFLPPDQTTMHYELQRKKDRTLFRTTLDKSSSLRSYRGLVLITPLKGGDCFFYKIDFFEPNLGIVKVLGQEKIWSESAITALQADRAMKLQLEHPDWDAKKVNKASNDHLDSARTEYRKLYNARVEFDPVAALPTVAEVKRKNKGKSISKPR